MFTLNMTAAQPMHLIIITDSEQIIYTEAHANADVSFYVSTTSPYVSVAFCLLLVYLGVCIC